MVTFNEQIALKLSLTLYSITAFNSNWSLSIDGISICFLLLTYIIIQCCIVYVKEDSIHRLKFMYVLIFGTQFCLFNFFTSSDLLVFFLFFEAVLIPMFLMIGSFGSRERRIHAAYQLFFYTLVGSFLMLLAIIYIYSLVGNTSFKEISEFKFTFIQEQILWVAFFFAFAIKIPLFPVHIWLPEAHVEAPTIGSVILAAIILKMGGFGIIKILLPFFPHACNYNQNFIFTLCAISMLYASFSALIQIDIKKIVAYSSIVHMSYATLGLFSFSVDGISSAILAMLSHGLISGGLFFSIGCLYDRYKTRNLAHYSSLVTFMPCFTICFFLFFLANMSFPGTANFPAELGIFTALFGINYIIVFFMIITLTFNACYNIWLATRILYGPITKNFIVKYYEDLVLREQEVFYYLIIVIILLGLKTNIVFDLIESDITSLLTNYIK
jgi:NADH-quinone oxidoreductase subunit M